MNLISLGLLWMFSMDVAQALKSPLSSSQTSNLVDTALSQFVDLDSFQSKILSQEVIPEIFLFSKAQPVTSESRTLKNDRTPGALNLAGVQFSNPILSTSMLNHYLHFYGSSLQSACQLSSGSKKIGILFDLPAIFKKNLFTDEGFEKKILNRFAIRGFVPVIVSKRQGLSQMATAGDLHDFPPEISEILKQQGLFGIFVLKVEALNSELLPKVLNQENFQNGEFNLTEELFFPCSQPIQLEKKSEAFLSGQAFKDLEMQVWLELSGAAGEELERREVLASHSNEIWIECRGRISFAQYRQIRDALKTRLSGVVASFKERAFSEERMVFSIQTSQKLEFIEKMVEEMTPHLFDVQPKVEEGPGESEIPSAREDGPNGGTKKNRVIPKPPIWVSAPDHFKLHVFKPTK